MEEQVIIIGSGGHAKVVIDIFERCGYPIIGLIDDFRAVGARTLGYEVIGGLKEVMQLATTHPQSKFFVAVGDNWLRSKISEELVDLLPDARFANAIHPAATLGRDVNCGVGVAIMAGAVVNSATRLGNFTIVNTGARVDHDSVLGAFSSIAPGAVMGGNVTVGDYSAVAIGAVVGHGVTVGKHTVIGAAGLQLADAGDREVWYGVPARKVRSREVGEKYM